MIQSTQLAVVEDGNDLALRPMTVLGVVLGLGLGVYIGSMLLAVAVVTVTFAMVGVRAVRGARAGTARRRLRDRRLTDAGLSRDGLIELGVLAAEIERQDPALASRFDLEDLLDRHVDLLLAHDRCVRALRMADREQLARARADQLLAGGSRRRAEVFERRIRCWDHARDQALRCADELSTLADLVRLLAQKAACPDVILDEDLLDRRLGELDEEESAMRQLEG